MSGNLNATNVARAQAAWGDDMPAWIRTLAEACDRYSQRAVGKQIGRHGSTISLIVGRKYEGSYAEAETLVRAAFGGETVRCPAIGDDIPLSGCLRNRRRAGPARNHLQQLFARTCPSCLANTDAGDAR